MHGDERREMSELESRDILTRELRLACGTICTAVDQTANAKAEVNLFAPAAVTYDVMVTGIA